MDKKYWWVLGALVLILLVAGYWQSTQNKAVSDEPIKIGAMFAQTGYAAFAGEASRNGFLLAIEDSGMDVEYVLEDFKSDPKTAVSVASKLMSIDKVPVVIGPEWAEFAEVVTPIANQNKVVFVSPWMVSEDKLAPPYYFSATPSDRTKLRTLVGYMATHGVKRLALVSSNNAWSASSVKTFKEELQKDGRITLVGEYKFEPNQTDYRTDIVKLKALNPDAVYSLMATDNSHGTFAKQLEEAGGAYPMYFDISRAESPVSREQFLPYLIGSIYPASKEYRNAKAFEEKYEKRFGTKPTALSAATTYDMTTLVLKAIKSGARTSDEIRSYLSDVKGYEGYSNTITFNDRGQVETEEVVIKRVTQGDPEILQ